MIVEFNSLCASRAHNSEVFWKLIRAIELVSYGGLRLCLCTVPSANVLIMAQFSKIPVFPIQTICFTRNNSIQPISKSNYVVLEPTTSFYQSSQPSQSVFT